MILFNLPRCWARALQANRGDCLDELARQKSPAIPRRCVEQKTAGDFHLALRRRDIGATAFRSLREPRLRGSDIPTGRAIA